VAAALEKVRPYLGSHAGDVEYLGIAPDGVLRLRLAGSCNGCPSSTVTVKLAIEQAVRESAPEITGVEVEGVAPPPGPTGPGGRPLLPLVTNGAPPPPPQPAKGRWVELAGFAELPLGSVAASRIDSTVAVVCNVNGGLYAYQDGCSACHASLAPGLLEGKVITCPSCGERYDAVLAGRSIRDGGPHLDPLPLLSDGGKIRIAVAS
jgi:Fe-S cluster biogenesis protein NfuA/nitrite reductase/ring-hydroxylating ferredoxin subunit